MLNKFLGRVAAAVMPVIRGFEHQLRTGRYTKRLGNQTNYDGRFVRYDGTSRRSTTMFYPNGIGERTRRMRQISYGQLTASNGLVRGTNFPKVDSHGRIAR